ncbi:hypothetical protein MFIFM68171_05611 [Madurella fahalii]|uniref:Uncharacterized protein n=1 Tax=Madurella fahalii TaxID=1157608 RepID=A0ABQ0GCD6_9PEZI
MANQLLRERDAPPRAKYEDPKVINEWFTLIQNVKAKYGIVDDDIYNFDETGFIIGIIFAVIQGVNALG